MTENIKRYILSQRFKYVTLGLVAGYFIALTQNPYRTIFIVAFVVIGTILSWRFSKNGRKTSEGIKEE